MEEKKKLRCPLGVPGGMIAALIGLIGVVVNIVNFNWFELITSFTLILVALPFIRVTMMVHDANDRLDELEKELSKVRQFGLSNDNEELEIGVRCMAAGIYDDQNKLVGGLSISAPSSRMEDAWLPRLKETASQISTTLGHKPTS